MKRNIILILALLCVAIAIGMCIYPVSAVTLSSNITISTPQYINVPDISGDTYSGTSGKYTDSTKYVYINNSASTEQAVTLEFSVSVGSSSCYISIDGTKYTANGSYTQTVIMSASSQITITLYAPKGKLKSAVTINSITSVTNATSEVTFVPATNGSYTVNGSTVTASTKYSCASSTGLSVAASANSGYEFVAWVIVNSDGTFTEIEGLGSSGTLRVNDACTVKPLFVASSVPMFWVNNKLFDSWTEAFTDAGESGTVLLYKSGTLSAGIYSIGAGQKLLIPYSVSHYSSADLRSAAFDEPAGTTTSGTRTAYRKLTLADGAVINCAGQISVDAQQYSSSVNDTGRVAGAYGQIVLSGSNSAINLNGSAVLYCYGYITGSGTVSANSGTAIHELFQMMDWRGGNVANSTYTKMKGESFLISQFYIQNVESHLVINSGADVVAHVTVAAALVGDKKPYASSLTLIGDDGLFILEDGASVSRTYTSNGRIEYEVNGNASIGSIALSVTVATFLGNTTVDMNSSDYVLNFPSNMTIIIKDGTTILPNKIKLLPDTVLKIEQDAVLEMSSGAELILYDLDDWTNRNYSWGATFKAINYSPSGARKTSISGNSQLIVDGTLTVRDGAAVYSTNDVNTENGNSCLSGTGTITWDTAPSSIRANVVELLSDTTGLLEDSTYGSYPAVALTLLQAPLAGISSSTADYTHSMSYGLIYKAHDGFWYNYTISLNDAVIGYVAKGGVYTYKNSNACTVTATNASVTNNGDGAFAITSTGGDIVLTVSNHSFTEYEWDESKSAYVACCDNGCVETDERELCISLASMTMANSLDMNFAFKKEHVTDWTGCYAVITKYYADGRDCVTQKVAFANWKSTTISGEAYYYVTFTGIAAKEMTDKIHVAIYNASGVRISNVWVDSVQTQAMRNLAISTNDLSKKMVVDMLYYGAAAQLHFGYATDDLATSQLSDEQIALASSDSAVADDSTVSLESCEYKANVYLKSNIQFIMGFSGLPDFTQAVVTFQNHRGATKTVTYTADNFSNITGSDGITYAGITISKTVVSDGRQTITCNFYNGEDIVLTVTDSIASYAARVADGTNSDTYKELVKMLMRYSDSAWAYFHPEEGTV